MAKFSKGEAIKFGWTTVKNNFGFFICIFIIMGLIHFAPNCIGHLIGWGKSGRTFVINIISLILSVIVTMGFINIALKLSDAQKAQIADLFTCVPLFLNFIIGSILYVLIVFAGMIILIIPGIVLAIKFHFYSYLIIDQGLGPIEALKKSSSITKGVKWNLFLFGLLLAAINILGVIALFVGTAVTMPIVVVALAFVYRQLSGQGPGLPVETI